MMQAPPIDIEQVMMNLIRAGLAHTNTYRALLEIWHDLNPGAVMPAWMQQPTKETAT